VNLLASWYLEKSFKPPFPADVPIDRKSGKVRVTRAVSAVDVGQIVNPHGVASQIEGGIIQSSSWTLMEAVRFDRTRVTTQLWADYPILRFEDVPQVEAVLLNRPEERFLGVGESSQGPTAAAIANATGKRLRGCLSRRSGSGRRWREASSSERYPHTPPSSQRDRSISSYPRP
jgi:Molybdopterin-binding domain of aldehyde dehydrogenase